MRTIVTLDENIIEEVHSAKLLGLIIDNQLTWNQHIDSRCSPMSKYISDEVSENIWDF